MLSVVNIQLNLDVSISILSNTLLIIDVCSGDSLVNSFRIIDKS